MNKYPIRINDKSKYESSTDTWESCAIFVNPENDPILKYIENFTYNYFKKLLKDWEYNK